MLEKYTNKMPNAFSPGFFFFILNLSIISWKFVLKGNPVLNVQNHPICLTEQEEVAPCSDN